MTRTFSKDFFFLHIHKQKKRKSITAADRNIEHGNWPTYHLAKPPAYLFYIIRQAKWVKKVIENTQINK